ncbi:efflux RND transporter permease subunit [Blastopirellula sp. JC732]|uniref:Efflux RND transporter permease subunit n=1 Tax=Blastopirellula sediminis TaxID=2894196 RepID=A0A9X1MMI5_9BACT|nr:efflux RND transporter permease subunit [Blastopirellula sediminis]MCC9608279.1 efflux RND transporter permease subunit [Blastopirellula sediminis]MCC9628950.1 efflux RND transporter permease subunit [Blastopirellula sediminis]
MNLAALAIRQRAVTYFGVFLVIAGGIFCYFQLGQLEDPEFSVKTAVITTTYPGATAQQVELEVTDRIETKLQEMSEVKNVYSNSRPGLSIIKVDIKSSYWSDRLPQVWDVLRKKVADVEPTLPSGAGKPKVGDDFGYVFGFLLAVSSDGFSYAELEKYVKDMRKELSVVKGVARVDFWGVQDKRIYLEVSSSQLAELNLTPAQIIDTLQGQNLVVDSGEVDFQSQRIRIAPTGEFRDPVEIGDLAIAGVVDGRDEIIRIRDFATVKTGYIDPPIHLLRHNGRQAIALAIAPASGENVVEVGERIDNRINELLADLPIGINVERISWQSDQVSESIRAFMVSLIEAVAIVLALLAVTMGIRPGIIIGISGLVFPILGTFVVMAIVGIDLHRISLGALIIAMGMMVDNAIVVTDGIMVRIAQGMDREKAAIEAAGGPAIPLLGATIVACMAFFPIFASSYDTGEYAGSLFTVVLISLLLSWVFCQTVAPLLCIAMLPGPKSGEAIRDPYQSNFYQLFRNLLGWTIRYRVLFLASMVGLLFFSVFAFRWVPQLYFPDSSRLQVMIDYWAPEGTRIQQTSANVARIEEFVRQQDATVSVSTFIGKGPPRFYLPVSAEDPYSSYAQIIINTKDLDGVNQLVADTDAWVQENVPEAMVRVRKYAVGAFDDWKIEARFSGPANADPETLRSLAEQGAKILRDTPLAKDVRVNWREPVQVLSPQFNEERARWAGVSREDLSRTMLRASEGVVVGSYRQEDDVIPIVARNVEAERERAATSLDELLVTPRLSTHSVPVSQIIDGVQLKWEDPLIWRWDRRRAITVQCSPNGVTAPTLRNEIVEEFNAIELPPGYRLDWDGEYWSAKQSQEALAPGMVPALVVMLFILVALFNGFRPMLICIGVIPFVMIGITGGLLLTQTPFGFIALLGAMSLSGMMIKNVVVLLDEVNVNLTKGLSPYHAVVEAAVSRLNPVVNAAGTTVLGVLPMLQDVFWVALAVTIFFGLIVGTLLTMVMVPTLYALLYRIPAPNGQESGNGE